MTPLSQLVAEKRYREIDALVAEKVMGYRLWNSPSNSEQRILARTQSDADKVLLGQELSCCTPTYSTEIAAAWEVVEHVISRRTQAVAVTTEFTAEYGWGWSCSFIPDPKLRLAIAQASAMTVPIAICLAAMKTIGLEKKRRTHYASAVGHWPVGDFQTRGGQFQCPGFGSAE